jgi:zona occludens toxin (predicted ATPase)
VKKTNRDITDNIGVYMLLDKTSIDAMSYEEMLKLWRFSPLGDPLFQGETGKYFSKKMYEKKAALKDNERIAASKRVGWERD